MNNLQKIFYFLFLITLAAACKKNGCFESAGAITTVILPLQSFETLILNDNINVVLKQDSLNQVIVEAPEHIQPNISFQITGNTLTISNNTDCRWLRKPGEKINAVLSIRNLNKIDYRGSGNITNTDTLHLDALQIESNTGAGNIELTVNNRYTGSYIYQENAAVILHGKTESCYSYTNAKGIINFADLATKKMVIEYGSLADTHINVTDEIDATIYYKGNLFYKGNPAITNINYYSSGRLINEH